MVIFTSLSVSHAERVDICCSSHGGPFLHNLIRTPTTAVCALWHRTNCVPVLCIAYCEVVNAKTRKTLAQLSLCALMYFDCTHPVWEMSTNELASKNQMIRSQVYIFRSISQMLSNMHNHFLYEIVYYWLMLGIFLSTLGLWFCAQP